MLLKKQKERPLSSLVLPKKKKADLKVFGNQLTANMTKTSRCGARDAWKEPTVDNDMYKTDKLGPRPFTTGSNAISTMNPTTPVGRSEQRPFSSGGTLS